MLPIIGIRSARYRTALVTMGFGLAAAILLAGCAGVRSDGDQGLEPVCRAGGGFDSALAGRLHNRALTTANATLLIVLDEGLRSVPCTTHDESPISERTDRRAAASRTAAVMGRIFRAASDLKLFVFIDGRRLEGASRIGTIPATAGAMSNKAASIDVVATVSRAQLERGVDVLRARGYRVIAILVIDPGRGRYAWREGHLWQWHDYRAEADQ